MEIIERNAAGGQQHGYLIRRDYEPGLSHDQALGSGDEMGDK